MDVVLERDRNAVERSANLARGAFAIPRFRFLERMRIHGDDGVELVFVGCDACEVLQDDFSRGDAALLHSCLHLADA